MTNPSTEESTLDAAMQRADHMLVSSLKRDEQVRRLRIVVAILSVMVIGLSTALGIVLMRTTAPAERPAPQIASTPVWAENLIQEGWQLWQQRRWSEAEAKFTDALRHEDNADAWNGLGWSRFNSGKIKPAISAFEGCILRNPSHPAGLNGLGQCYYAMNELDKAEPFLLKAANLNATAAWWGLAKTYLLQGKWDAAEKWSQKLVDSGDRSAQPLLDAAKAKKLPEELRQTIQPPTRS